MITAQPSFAAAATRWMARVHDAITGFFCAEESLAFAEESWSRPGGGGGISRSLAGGTTFEKVGVNRSAVGGALDPGLAGRLALAQEPPTGSRFFATGVSVVAHPRSPMVPTVHLNVRYFEVTTPDGAACDAWFGGGTDLTPTYPFPEDAIHFHQVLAEVCARHHPDYYPRFKAWCDEYFRNLHRGGEARGVGGIFFDHLRPGPYGELEQLRRFVDEIGRSLPRAYGVILQRRRHLPFGERERRFQLYRRGRYAEFNLLHDRGTAFGLQSGARAESVLMSLPPLAAWDLEQEFPSGGFEAALVDMLRPRSWATLPSGPS